MPEGCPSGQREQTVNLPAIAFEGSNPSPSTVPATNEPRTPIHLAGVAQLVERQPSKLNVAGSNPVSRSIEPHPRAATERRPPRNETQKPRQRTRTPTRARAARTSEGEVRSRGDGIAPARNRPSDAHLAQW